MHAYPGLPPGATAVSPPKAAQCFFVSSVPSVVKFLSVAAGAASLAIPSPMRLNSSAMDMTEVLIWGAIVAFGGFIFWLIRWWNGRGRENFRDRRTTGWPVVPATVENYEIVYSTRRVFTLVVYYSYSVNSKFYSGEFSRYQIGTEARARDAGEQWVHKKIMVRHKPNDPAKSVFVEKDSQMSAQAG
jgi:hypothetical protein